MLRLKIILHSKKLYIICFILIIFLFILSINKKSIYSKDTNELVCVINSYYVSETKINLNLSCNENILGTLYINDYKEIEEFINTYNYKDKIKVYGSLKEIEGPTNINEFDYKTYYKIRGIYYRVTINRIEKLESYNMIYSILNFFKDRIDNLKSKNIIYSLVFGNKKYLEEDRLDLYKNLGIMHLFSVSGMHISILIELINKLSNRESKSKNIFILVLLFSYYLIVNTVSIYRAFISYLITLLNNKYNLDINKYLKVLLIVIIILLTNPLYILDSSFYLSVITGSILIIYSNHIKDKNVFVSYLKISLLCSIVTFPLISYIYNEVNILSFITTYISSFIITYLIFPLSIITIIFPVLDDILYISFDLFNFIISSLSVINITLIFKKDIIFVFIYYLIIALSYKNRKVLIIFLLLIVIHYNIIYIFPSNYVYFYDIGQGDSILLSINNKNYLIDTGGKYGSSYNIAKNEIVPVLKSLGIRKLDALITSHGDFDHMGESINLVNEFKIDKVIFNCGEFNELEKELIDELNKLKIDYYSCIKELKLDKVKMLFLNTKEYDDENENSVVIYTEVNGYKLLFMGDAGIEREKDILNKYNLKEIDVLKVGHHGSKTSSSKEFINKIKPKYSIISVGKNNRYGHPNKEVLDVLKDSKIFRTDQEGGIMIRFNNLSIEIYTK